MWGLVRSRASLSVLSTMIVSANLINWGLPVCAATLRPPPRQASAELPGRQESQADASGKESFEVASVKSSKGESPVPSNLDLGIGDSQGPPDGRFVADVPMRVYIEFAYKVVLTRDQFQELIAKLPKWVATDRFVIEARAEGNPTKDQMRLMMAIFIQRHYSQASLSAKCLPH